MSTFLTEEELAQLTDASHAKKQIKWLADRAWPFEVSTTGKAKVLRATMERKMGVVTLAGRRKVEPDAEALREMIRGKKKAS